MKKEKILFSIIIPVIKINDYIYLNISKIKKQINKSYEIIILPNKKESLKLKKIETKNIKLIASGNVGPARKRDIGFQKSKGEIIVFLDDDSYPANNFFKTAKKIFKNKKKNVIGGPGITPIKSTISEKLSSVFFSSILGGGFPERYYPIGNTRKVDEWPTVNFLIRRNIFKKVNGFDRDIWPGEDTFLCKKLTIMNESIYYEPSLRVWHFRRSNILLHLKQVSNYGFLRGKLCRENFNPLKDLKYYIPSIWTLVFFLLLSSIKFNFLLLNIFLGTYFLLIFFFLILSKIKERISIKLISLIYFFLSHFFYGFNFLRSFILK